MMCPGLWTLDLGCDSPLDSRAFTLRFLVFLTRSLYSQLSSFCLRIAPFPSSSCTIRTTIHTRVRTLLAHYNYIYHEHDIHPPRTTPIEFYTSSSLLLTVFPCPFLSMFFFFTFYDQVLSISFHAHSCFMSITVFICHSSRLSVSILSCLSLCHAHLTSTATHKPSHTAAQYNFS